MTVLTIMTYSQKLRDPRWQKKRLQILERDGWKCRACGDAENNLQVHHVVYRKIDPWDYPDECLQTLCCDCHELRQFRMDKLVDQFRMHLKEIANDDILDAHTFFINVAEAYERSSVTPCVLPEALFKELVEGVSAMQVLGNYEIGERISGLLQKAARLANGNGGESQTANGGR